jgi:hypothetical protein
MFLLTAQLAFSGNILNGLCQVDRRLTASRNDRSVIDAASLVHVAT